MPVSNAVGNAMGNEVGNAVGNTAAHRWHTVHEKHIPLACLLSQVPDTTAHGTSSTAIEGPGDKFLKSTFTLISESSNSWRVAARRPSASPAAAGSVLRPPWAGADLHRKATSASKHPASMDRATVPAPPQAGTSIGRFSALEVWLN